MSLGKLPAKSDLQILLGSTKFNHVKLPLSVYPTNVYMSHVYDLPMFLLHGVMCLSSCLGNAQKAQSLETL